MKRIIFISLGALLLMLSACVSESGSSSASASVNSEAAVSPIAQPPASGTAEAITETETEAVTASPGSGSIIIESSNAVSDKEKQAILDDLSNQLDLAFSGTQDMEDPDDSDLDTNNIE